MKKICLLLFLGSLHLACVSNDDRYWKETKFWDGLKLRTAFWANNQFVVSGSDKSGQLIYLTSSDGASWVQHGTGLQGDGFIALNNQYVTVEKSSYDIFYSNDLIVWTKIIPDIKPAIDTSGTYHYIIYDGKRYISVDSAGNIKTSSDFLTWTVQPLANPKWDFHDLFYANNMYFAYGYTDSNNALSHTIFSSTDGLNWREVSDLRGIGFASVSAYGKGKFVVVGDGGAVFTSNDGKKWSNHGIFAGPNLDKVVGGSKDYIALSSKRTLEIWSISDSVNWKKFVYRPTPEGLVYWVRDPDWNMSGASNGSTYVVVGYECLDPSACHGFILTLP
ncbi:MAG: hypothetical protein OEV66_03665 [Spirochaetia bacterium]|nr:hypothetical protein [Spirochaetia bacterium]